MLNIETKRKIDNARDVLVGKIPNPQTQIEQITTALIYKFMDDMDERAKTMGGKARFFVGDFEKYSWRTLLDPRMGGQERMNLYSEAVQKLSQNPALPQIFRDIFKDALVPYRDPETLSLFLKEINWFDYHHSEELGNAYEYLLSIMSSQGDAGQFRTPRHIIDFIVEAVDPQKDETVLDPACGTAGFLISAYKHILRQNDGIDDVTGLPSNKEIKLSPEERAKLLKNFSGYDIDPGMVKLSLVNMYLHGFVMPSIEEYDSLTYDDHWSDDFDVILANPPFMTPKGGVRPHKRFQIQANRAEVLFVDYILEHLKPGGKAGIVVPESIIFQSGKNYKQLRKLLIENGLYGVVSFPPGLFLPYADARTSVLLIDKNIAKESDSILFLNPRHFGHSLTTRIRKINDNDLPKCLDVINNFKLSKSVDDKVHSSIAFTVKKEIILNEKDCDLSQEYYREYTLPVTNKYKFQALGSYIKESKDKVKDGNYRVWSVSNTAGFVPSDEYFGNKVASENISAYKIVKPGYFAYNPARINVGSIAYNNTQETGAVSPMYTVFSLNSDKIDPTYLLAFLKSSQAKHHIKRLSQGTVRQQLRYKELSKIMLITEGEQLIDFVKNKLSEIQNYEKQINNCKFEIDNKIAEVWGE